MRLSFTKFFFFVALVLTTALAFSQYTYFKPKEGFGIEVSLSNSALKRMPMYRNSIASLIVTGDNIIGGTCANELLSPYIFVASLTKRELVQLQDVNNIIQGQRSVQSGFFKTKDNTLYAGTIANKINDSTNGNGHLVQVNVDANGTIIMTDLGIPVANEGVYAIAGNINTNFIYGITYPSGIFFSYNIISKLYKSYKGSVPDLDDLNSVKGEFHQQPETYLCNALIVDDKGMVYGSKAINKLFYFDPANDSFHILADLPEIWGRRSMGRVESWVKSGDGQLYGGNGGDGQLFQVDPATKQIKNLGKPIMMNRLRGMCYGADGKLYGLAGALPGYAHLFSYDAKQEGFTDLGNPQFILKAPGIEQGIEWRGFQLRTIAASDDGKYIVMGEDEALSQLLIFPVGK